MAREISHEVPKPAVRKLVTDVVEPNISVEILTVQQEVNSVIDVGWKDIFKSSAGPVSYTHLTLPTNREV